MILALLGVVGGFYGVMFRMEHGEESVALTWDMIVGLLFAGACFLGVLALPSGIFRTSRKQLKAAFVPSVASAFIIPALLFSWQWSILEGRRRNAQNVLEHQTSEQDGTTTGTQPIRSETNRTSPAARR